MNRTMRAAAVAAIFTSGFGSVGCMNTGTGCGAGGCGGAVGGGGIGGARGEGHGPIGDCWRKFVDPCYPERYQFAARESVVGVFGQQTVNGHFLNQSIWNYYFEFGTDKLTPAGVEKLDSLARTRPAPDPKLYIQTARDLVVNADTVGKIDDLRKDLDARRAAAVQKYMGTQPALAPVAYEVYVHDAPVPGINAEMALRAYNGSFPGYRGGITGTAGIGALGTGGSNNLTVSPVINNSGAGAGAGAGGATGGR